MIWGTRLWGESEFHCRLFWLGGSVGEQIWGSRVRNGICAAEEGDFLCDVGGANLQILD